MILALSHSSWPTPSNQVCPEPFSPDLLYALRDTSQRPLDALNSNIGRSLEIPFDQAGIGERINREAKAVTIQANRPDHFLVRPQIIILVVVGHDLSAALVLRKMTRRATHACSRRRIPGQFGAPRRVCELPK